MKIEYDRYSIKINDNRKFIWSGAIHYYRLPAVEMWEKRLKLIKEAGLNAVDVYFPWNYHTEEEGKYNFSGNRDVDRFLDIIEELGLYLIARPGPNICSEIDAGGFPGWLMAKKDIILRCRRGGRIEYDENYMKYVREWWEVIVPKIAKRKNLILFQIENEFNLLPHTVGPMRNVIKLIRRYNPEKMNQLLGSEAFKFLYFKILSEIIKHKEELQPNQYCRTLYDWSKELGINVPIFHNDINSISGRVGEVDIMAIDDYPITDFKSDWRKNRLTFASTDLFEEGLDLFRRDNPVCAVEFQSSWFDNWGGYGFEDMRRRLGVEQLDLATKSAVAQRATLISYFLFVGCTSWGYISSPDVYTSCDFMAPVAECGLTTERFDVIKWLIEEFESLGEDFLETEPDGEVTCRPRSVFCKARKSLSGKRYVFLRNLGGPSVKCRVSCMEEPVRLGRTEMRVLALDESGRLIKEIGPYKKPAKPAYACRAPKQIMELSEWTTAWASPQLIEGFDDSGWRLIEDEPSLDFDSLGNHYGYGWYRGTFIGRLKSIEIDARHCFSVYLNGRLAASKDNFLNSSGVGEDEVEVFNIPLSSDYQHGDMNVITILVESLGHNKDFECDSAQPRGIVSLKSYGASVVWRFRPGLIPGEKGLCPVIPKKYFKDIKPKVKINTPHFWEPREHGVYLYETEFTLDIKAPDENPVGIVLHEAHSKANIYVNGYLMGRYWHEKGPQNKFYIPWGVLNPTGKNHLAIAVWKRWEAGFLGKVTLEGYSVV